ncbi:dynamin family protein [Streptomyces sp. MNP-20]|uniref:dynamin family protein n=1 Tax=Streptomyces sp. MNP-20 TaxID=2721165 RepID=UPI0015568A9F|nr:dynamin family protein [Streptomyces sp. MNP-20]
MGASTDTYAQWAVGMLEALERAPAHERDEGALASRRAEFRSGVAHLLGEARDPLSIGIVGEFSAGKSLLIEALLGMPGLLSVSHVPTTGNVTAIRVDQSGDDEPGPTLQERSVVYCTAPETAELMAHLHRRIGELAGLEGLGERELDALRAARPGAEGWQPLVDWCHRHGRSAQGSKMAAVAAETLRLHDAYEEGAPLLGRRYDLSDAQAKRAMSLPDAPADPGGGWDRRDAVAPGGRIPDDVLTACVPLIRKIELRVRVPRAVWDLADVGALTLLDFPGLNSQMSGERDRFLSRRELRDIHTVLVLMNAQRGPVGSEQDFFDMLREPTADGRERRSDEELRESILVAGGRFDQLPVDDPAGLRAALLDSPERLTERRLRGQPDTAMLDTIVEAAQSLLPAGQHKQLILVSPMVGLAALRASGALGGEGAGGARARVREADGGAGQPALTGLWARVADRLEADAPGSRLIRALREYAHDGGLRLLRGELTGHAREHGGTLKAGAVRRRATAVDRARLALITAERSAHPEVEYPPAYQEIQRTLHATRQALAALREVLVLERATDGARGDDALRRYLVDEAAMAVAAWPQWKELFAAVDRERHLVVVPHATEGDADFAQHIQDELALLGLFTQEPAAESDPAPGIPEGPEELLVAFRGSHEALLALVHDRIRAAYEERLDEHAGVLEDLRRGWIEITAEEQRRGGLAPPRRDRLGALIATTNPEWYRAELRQTVPPQPDPADVDAGFPLRLDRCFPWHPDQPEDRDPLERHVAHVVRMRRELVAALVDLVHGHLAAHQAEFARQAGKALAQGERFVNATDTPELLLSGLRADGAARGATSLDLAGRLEAMPLPRPSPHSGAPQGARVSTVKSPATPPDAPRKA